MSASCLLLSCLLDPFFSVLAHGMMAPYDSRLFYLLSNPSSDAGDGP